MKIEQLLLLSASLLFLFSLFFIPKPKRRQAQFIFIFVQFPTWLLGLMAVETGLLQYPVHELAGANSTSFVFEYLILPIYCIHFNMIFPEDAAVMPKLLFYGAASGLLTGVEVIVERYTDIIDYIGWTWPMTFLSVAFILWLSRIMTNWFFSKKRGMPADIKKRPVF